MARYQRYNTRSSKLSWADVQEIRRLYTEERWSQGRLARAYSMSVVQIGRIVRGESQTKVPDITDDDALINPNAPPLSPEILAEMNAKLKASLEKKGQPKGETFDEMLDRKARENPLSVPRKDDPPTEDSQS